MKYIEGYGEDIGSLR